MHFQRILLASALGKNFSLNAALNAMTFFRATQPNHVAMWDRTQAKKTKKNGMKHPLNYGMLYLLMGSWY